MTRLISAVVLMTFLLGSHVRVRADEKDKEAVAVLDKAIEALGCAENLKKAKALTWASKGTVAVMGEDNNFTTDTTTQGIENIKSNFSGNFGGMEFVVLSVIKGKSAWIRINDMTMELPEERLASSVRDLYLRVAPTLITPLKGEAFKVESAGEEKAGDATHKVLKITGPDGKDFRLYFEKDSGLPAKMVATVEGFDGQEFAQESTYKDYKDFSGIKVATKISRKRDGERFIEEEVTEFKAHESVDPKTFDEPQ